MAYLIDGNNLLGHLFPGRHRDPDNKLKLVRRLLAFKRSKKARIILVFDGAPSADADGMAMAEDRFDIIYPPAGESADAAIRDILSGRTDLRKMSVVSSDREIKADARRRGASVLTSREFSAELNRALKERKREKEMEKNEARPTSLEVHLWSQVFKEDK